MWSDIGPLEKENNSTGDIEPRLDWENQDTKGARLTLITNLCILILAFALVS